MKNNVIRSRLNSKLEVSLTMGHFATRHSHNSHYIDITRMKHEHTMAREAAITLAERYAYEKGVDTIVCLDGSEVIGAFLARHLAKNTLFAVNGSKNINIVSRTNISYLLHSFFYAFSYGYLISTSNFLYLKNNTGLTLISCIRFLFS